MKAVLTLMFLITSVWVGVSYGQIPTDSLIAYYPFNGNANDESGNGYNGVNHNAQFVADRQGNPSQALGLSINLQSYIEIPNSGPVVLNDLFTIAFWIKLEGQGNISHSGNNATEHRNRDAATNNK